MNGAERGKVRRLPNSLKVKAGLIPDRVAHDNTFRVLTIGEWDKEGDEVAGGLAAAGLKPGDRVFLPITNKHTAEMAIAVIATMRAGGIGAPLNTRLTHEEIKDYAAQVEPRFAITDSPEKLEGLNLERVWLVDQMPRDLSALPDQSTLDAEADALIVGTSGTTGRPKGIVLNHPDLTATLGDGSHYDKNANATLHSMPFTGFGGMTGQCLLPIMMEQISLTQPTFEAGGFLRLIEQKRPTTLFLVPTMLRLLLDHPDVAKTDFSSVRTIMLGTAPLPNDSVVRAVALWPNITLRNGYGMSEGGVGAVTTSREAVLKPGCVGKMPPHMEIRDENGKPVPAGTVGEIYGRMTASRRYWRDAESTSRSWVGGWTKSGDLGYVDEDGDLILTGRSKELIIRGGYNITPLEIEDALHDHPAVKDAAVMGVSHDVLGEDIAAAVSLKSGAQATEEELIVWCRARLADNKIPRTVVFFKELPVNQNAKILKRELLPHLETAAHERRAARHGAAGR